MAKVTVNLPESVKAGAKVKIKLGSGKTTGANSRTTGVKKKT